jgi:hypothetical protein
MAWQVISHVVCGHNSQWKHHRQCRFIDGPNRPCAAALNSFLILRFSTSQHFPSVHVSFDPSLFYYQMFTPSVSACPRDEVGAVPGSLRPSLVEANTTAPKAKPSISSILRQSFTEPSGRQRSVTQHIRAVDQQPTKKESELAPTVGGKDIDLTAPRTTHSTYDQASSNADSPGGG